MAEPRYSGGTLLTDKAASDNSEPHLTHPLPDFALLEGFGAA
jgi:hypothetical protein